jgi:diacylglycerol kinase (ATP)
MSTLPFRHISVIANPIAGAGRGAPRARELVHGLQELGAEVELHLTSARGDGARISSALSERCELVISVGGDGTLREVLHGLPRADLPVGLLPLGTANVLALDLGLPRHPRGLIELVRKGNTQRIDTALVNGTHLSFLVTSVGFDAMVVTELDRRRRGPITKLDWLRAGFVAFWNYRQPRLELELDGEKQPGVHGLVMISNIVHFAGFEVLASDRVFDDGLFEVYVFHAGSRTALLAYGLRALFARFPSRACTRRRARTIRVSAREPVPFQIDGDPGGTTPVELVVGSLPFRMLVP